MQHLKYKGFKQTNLYEVWSELPWKTKCLYQFFMDGQKDGLKACLQRAEDDAKYCLNIEIIGHSHLYTQ